MLSIIKLSFLCSLLCMIRSLALISHKLPIYKSRVMSSFLSTQTSLSTLSSMTSSATEGKKEWGYVDAHAHLIHEKFEGEEDEMAVLCAEKGLDCIVVNGLEPISNRKILEYSQRHQNILPAMGIYPLDAICNMIQDDLAASPEVSKKLWNFDFDAPARFDVDAEIDFIDQMAAEKKIVAVGECGLDLHYVTDPDALLEQERVLRKLMRVAKKHDIPIILHTRKAEERVFEILIEESVTKADLHCYCGKSKLGAKMATTHGFYFSIPSAVERTGSFQKLVKDLPLNRILTETDCPYMGPDKGVRNDPRTVPRGVAAIALVKGLPVEDVKLAIRQNFKDLFGL